MAEFGSQKCGVRHPAGRTLSRHMIHHMMLCRFPLKKLHVGAIYSDAFFRVPVQVKKGRRRAHDGGVLFRKGAEVLVDQDRSG